VAEVEPVALSRRLGYLRMVHPGAADADALNEGECHIRRLHGEPPFAPAPTSVPLCRSGGRRVQPALIPSGAPCLFVRLDIP